MDLVAPSIPPVHASSLRVSAREQGLVDTAVLATSSLLEFVQAQTILLSPPLPPREISSDTPQGSPLVAMLGVKGHLSMGPPSLAPSAFRKRKFQAQEALVLPWSKKLAFRGTSTFAF